MRNFILSALLLASAFQTALGDQSGDWTYTVLNGQATITGYTGAGGAVTVPSVVNGIPVVVFGNGWWPAVFSGPDFSNGSVTSVTIPDSVTSITDKAFGNCYGLNSVTIGKGLTSIGREAFTNCDNLKSVLFFSRNMNIYSSTLHFAPSATVLYIDQFEQMANNDDFVNALANNDAFVTAVANKIKGTSGNYGLTTQTGLSSAIEPLATKTQITTAINEGRASGIASVTASPNTWSLFTTSQIQNMAVGDLVLTRTNGSNLVLNYDIEQSEDLQTWTTYQGYALPLTNLPTNKAFVRIKAKQ